MAFVLAPSLAFLHFCHVARDLCSRQRTSQSWTIDPDHESQSDKPFTAHRIIICTPATILVHLVVAMAQSPLDRPPPSAASYAIAAAIISFTTGYFVGKARSIGLFGRSPVDNIATVADGADDDDDSGSDSEESAQDLGELETFGGSTEECKLVLVVRTDLGMTKGRSNRVSECRVSAVWSRGQVLHLYQTTSIYYSCGTL